MGVVSCGKRTQDKSLNYCGDSPLPRRPPQGLSRGISRGVARGTSL